MASVKQVIQNASFLSAAYVGQKVLSFIYFTLIARFVGVLDTGVYVFALSYSTMCSVLVDFGLANFLQREIARKPADARPLLSAALALKLVYGAITVVFGLLLIRVLSHDAQTLRMVSIAMAIMLFDSYALTIWSAFRGRHLLSNESVAIVSSQALVMLVGLVGLFTRARLEVLMLALLAGSVWTAVYATHKCRAQLGFWPYPGRLVGRNLARESLPFGLAGMFTRMFASLDSVMLGQMVGKAAVGFYAIPNKFVFAAQFMPAAVAAALYPALSHYHAVDEAKMRTLFLQALSFLYVIAAPMAAGLFVISPMVVRELYTSEYEPSIVAMQILVWGIIFGFIEFPFGSFIAASGEQRKNTVTRGIVVLVNVALNLALIPSYSFVGTAIAALVSYAVLAGMGAFWTRRVWLRAGRPFWAMMAKTTCAAAAMAIAVYAILPFAHFAVAIVFGVVVYTGLVLLLRIMTISHVRFLLQSFRRREASV